VKLGKRHLAGSLALLAAAIAYNVWVFTRPADRPAGVRPSTPAPITAALPIASTDDAAAPGHVDPSQVRPLPDVALDRQPEWPRDPFAGLQPSRQPQAMPIAAEPVVVPDPDPVVASILYSQERRLATLDARIVRVGDTVGSAIVVDILPNAVIIESPDRGRRTLTLSPGAGGMAR
jgi:hypothetical protein